MKNTLFGTDGIRATVGTCPLTGPELQQLGNALGTWMINQYGPNTPIVIGYDTRTSCHWIKAALKSGLLAHPITIYDAGLLPTPAIMHAVKQSPVALCGLMISASHNPYQDNGIKLIAHGPTKFTPAQEEELTRLFYSTPKPTYQTFGTDIPYNQAEQDYCARIQTFFPQQFLQGLRIVIDTAHGALYRIAPKILQQFGATVYQIGDQPNGTNINAQCGAVYPQAVQKAVLAQKADIGFAFDGDGDRIIAVNNQGIIKDGDAIVALLADHPSYQHMSCVVGTTMSNQGLEIYLKQRHKELARTAVGDKYVAAHMQQHGLLLGAEQSGHVICGDFLPSGDGLFTALRVLQMIKQNPTLTTFTPTPQLTFNLATQLKPDLAQEPFATLIKTCHATLQGGRLLIRYSGTEPVLRIMIEHPDQQVAHTCGSHLTQELNHLLSL